MSDKDEAVLKARRIAVFLLLLAAVCVAVILASISWIALLAWIAFIFVIAAKVLVEAAKEVERGE
jgi:hypothetical protein